MFINAFLYLCKKISKFIPVWALLQPPTRLSSLPVTQHAWILEPNVELDSGFDECASFIRIDSIPVSYQHDRIMERTPWRCLWALLCRWELLIERWSSDRLNRKMKGDEARNRRFVMRRLYLYWQRQRKVRTGDHVWTVSDRFYRSNCIQILALKSPKPNDSSG